METAPEELLLHVVLARVLLVVRDLHQVHVLHVHTEVQPLHRYTVTVRPLLVHMGQAVLHEAQQDLHVDTQVLDQLRVAHVVLGVVARKVEALATVEVASEIFVVHISTCPSL